jgi:hypothetical protein
MTKASEGKGSMTTTTLTTELPKELQGDPAWCAVLYLLEEAFPSEPRVWKYVDAKRWSIHFDGMLNEGSWSGGERILVEVAASLFDGESKASLWTAGQRLSNEHWAAVLEALLSVAEKKGASLAGETGPVVWLRSGLW